MKKLALVAFSLTLADCGSNKQSPNGPIAQAMSQNSSGASAQAVKPAAKPADAAPAVACPVLNASYLQKGTAMGDITITVVTKVNAGVYSYSFDGGQSLVAADGKPHSLENNGQKITATETCDAKSIKIVAQVAGQADSVTAVYSVLPNDQLKVQATGDLAQMNGVYTKKK